MTAVTSGCGYLAETGCGDPERHYHRYHRYRDMEAGSSGDIHASEEHGCVAQPMHGSAIEPMTRANANITSSGPPGRTGGSSTSPILSLLRLRIAHTTSPDLPAWSEQGSLHERHGLLRFSKSRQLVDGSVLACLTRECPGISGPGP